MGLRFIEVYKLYLQISPHISGAIDLLTYYFIPNNCTIALHNFIIVALVYMRKHCALITSLKMTKDSRNMSQDILQNNNNCIVLLLCNQLEQNVFTELFKDKFCAE